ncbi:RnfABCDGE type electron transport complex subunit B [Motiliproteus sp. MSK22-1]|uniref:RnfABCDGE type electron transport complex subunit B n=1 Tax=Motiliproteus sp. MSK22-1 TaxID=1897630 RepID=UPI000975B4CF|nr:RnfABCDGE type electron transport complex subunit B [Motiliproteus sp. MSK22-1]OMH33845.1 electron transporter RnfB [Motiliproteus sp. MSK22-1]
MITAVTLLTLIGTLLGLGLGAVNRYLPVKEDPLRESLSALLPGTQCGQCGYAGCRQAAEALAEGTASVNLCPPGGPLLVQQLGSILGREEDSSDAGSRTPVLAWVNPDLCTGCTKCLRECPTDALVGAAKQLHVVLDDACTGCGACTDVCPTEGISMQEVPLTLTNWHWPNPQHQDSGPPKQGAV